MRRGVAFGPELTKAENESGKSMHGRGLLFTCYQSSITNGFQFLQQTWANNPNFPPFTGKTPGLDPLIGQGVRNTDALDPLNEAGVTSLPPFILPKGGEYFFTPGLNGLKTTIAKA